MILLIILTLHLDGINCVYSNDLTSVVQTDKGPVQGEIRKTIRRSIEFSSFRGIRYGKAPTGYMRFKPPVEAEPWSEIFDATAEGTPCPQLNSLQKTLFSDEDCLNLNVYSPKINFNSTDDTLLPVMVWIYGGAFMEGYINMSLYGPDFLIENGVVVVAMNYRLGILGFLSLNLPGATGNAGLKDQQLALKWVRKNIKLFGGDPSSVTIFGQSAGAVSVDYHALSEGSQGLFHRSISMSGSPLCLWAFSSASQAEERAFRVGRLLGINTTDKAQLLQELHKQSPYDLVMASGNMSSIDPVFKPTLEDSKVAGDTAFLSECSINKYKSRNFAQVPSITGFMASEVLTFTQNSTAVKEAINRTISLNEALNIILHSHDLNLDMLVALGALTNGTFQDLTKILSDVLYISGVDIKQRFLARYSTAPVYYYRNSFAPYPSLHRFVNGIKRIGAAHSDDLAYCWYISIVNFPTAPDDPFVITQERISRMWTNFAKYSNPTPFGDNDLLLNISWPVSGMKGKHLEINDEFSVGGRPIDQITRLHGIISKQSMGRMNEC